MKLYFIYIYNNYYKMDKDILLVTFIVNDTTLTIENPTPEIIAEIKQQYPGVQLIEEKKPIKPKEKKIIVYFPDGFYLELKNPTDDLIANICESNSNAIVCEEDSQDETVKVMPRELRTVVMNPMGSTHLFSLFSLS